MNNRVVLSIIKIDVYTILVKAVKRLSIVIRFLDIIESDMTERAHQELQ